MTREEYASLRQTAAPDKVCESCRHFSPNLAWLWRLPERPAGDGWCVRDFLSRIYWHSVPVGNAATESCQLWRKMRQ